MELSGSNIKNFFFILSKESFSYISGNGNPEKIPYISGNGNFLYFRKLLIIHEVTFPARKMKKPTLKKLLIFQQELRKSENQKLHTFCLLRDFKLFKHKRIRKKFLILSL